MDEDFKNFDFQPIFIVGMPRTGSKIFKNIVNHNSNINISPEIFFITPSWIRHDFINLTKSKLGRIESEENLQKLVNLMFDNTFFGTYWRDIKGNKSDMLAILKKTDKSFKEIFIALLKYDAHINGKTKIGAKFPVHIASAKKLQNWFPEAKFIHLNRHPLAIYNSQKRKHLKNQKGWFNRQKMSFKILIVTILTYRSSCNFFKANRNNSNYLMCTYENLINDSEEVIKRLCEFLEINYKQEMLYPPAKGSSYQLAVNSRGIHNKSGNRWEKEVNLIEKTIFKLFTKMI
ncbi:sulfotransferase family protein [Flexithrix dorotheae]|uniref:sulfotransferase family protein n=1 Tax=Flexithrix dorotheae TaxID=70993 RepID=UPI00039BE579|nr:sulfotransferase [Flexithrix dorotheae]